VEIGAAGTMAATIASGGTSSAESLLTRFRAREAVLVLLIGSILLNVLLVTRVHVIEMENVRYGKSVVTNNNGAAYGLDNFSKVSAGSKSDEEVARKDRKKPNAKNKAKKGNANPKEASKPNSPSSLLQCQAYGGPSDEAAAEMVYWRRDVPEVKQFHSIYDGTDKYFVYEPDEAGFSNVRMSFETVVALAKASGRTLVLTPTMRFAQLLHPHPEGVRSYSYLDYFDISNIPHISMDEYITRVALTGQLKDKDGQVSFPPYNRTNWDGRLGNTGNSGEGEAGTFFQWLSDSATPLTWKRDRCVIPFPSTKDQDMEHMRAEVAKILKDDNGKPPYQRSAEYNGKPIPVNSSMPERLREMLADRKELCEFGKEYQDAKSVYMTGHERTGSRPLIMFFAYLFFETWEQDVQMKRFIRDSLRFSDVLQCAAARIVEGIRKIAREAGKGNNENGSFDTMHVRREDFKWVDVYKDGLVDASKMVEDEFFERERTVYIATDERDKSFFSAFREHHTVVFLHDFDHLIEGIDPNYYGMIEQLVCSKGDKFVGTYFSTFTGYINRVRGYHAQKNPSPETLTGFLNSEYMGHDGNYRKATHVSLLLLMLLFCAFTHAVLLCGCLCFFFVELRERATTVLVKRMANCLERH
jgi:GDP-fucose protein O-fucosyltransferase